MTLLSITTMAALLAAPLFAPTPAVAQDRQTWESTSPRAGSVRVEREPLDRQIEELPPHAGAPGYSSPTRDSRSGDAYRPPRPLMPSESAASYRDAPPYREIEPYREAPPYQGYGERYAPPPRDAGAYDPSRRRDHDYDEEPTHDGTFSSREITRAGHGFFGSISRSLGDVIEYAFKSQGRPNGYILGEDLGGAFVAGLRYGEGTLYTRDAGRHKVFWQGPSIGYDAGAEGSKVMVLVYNLRDPSEIYERFGGVAGSAYVVGGVGLTFQRHNHVVLAPIRSGIGLRLGANIGYLKYTRRPTWNPF